MLSAASSAQYQSKPKENIMKKTLLGLLAASALLVGSSSFAEAKANFHVYFGVPYYDYQVGPGSI